MRIQIYGAGMAGSYLYMLLSGEYEVGIKDVRSKPDCRCAWGIAYRQAKELYKVIGVNLDEYFLIKPRYAVANGIEFRNRNIVIFDRKRLLEDLWDQIEFREIQADLKVDATGHSRALLPKIDGGLYPTIQTIEKHDAEENIYAYARRTGYAWAFPLGDGLWHVGAGDLTEERAKEMIEKLRQKYGFEKKDTVCTCRAKVRMLPPSKCRPFIHGNVVGVGEAIGCVSGFGEGNAPALQCAKLLYQCLVEGSLHEYEERVLREFRWVEREHAFVENLQKGKILSAFLRIPWIILTERKRSAELSLGSIISVLRSLGS